jgi:prepilin-type N-terminal cleavage/methylation domain-containing protein
LEFGAWNLEFMRIQTNKKAFTLVELLVALMVAAIVLTAAATMADAMACGKEACDQMNRSTAYLLQVQTRLSDLIMRANGATINLEKNLLTLGYDTDGDIEISTDGQSISIDGESWGHMQNVSFDYDDDKLVTVEFVLTEDGTPQTYQLCAALRGK